MEEEKWKEEEQGRHHAAVTLAFFLHGLAIFGRTWSHLDT